MKNCAQLQLQKEQKADNNVCQYCGKTFMQKSNMDCHVRQHEDGIFDHTETNEWWECCFLIICSWIWTCPSSWETWNQQSNADGGIDSVPHQTNPQKYWMCLFLVTMGMELMQRWQKLSRKHLFVRFLNHLLTFLYRQFMMIMPNLLNQQFTSHKLANRWRTHKNGWTISNYFWK